MKNYVFIILLVFSFYALFGIWSDQRQSAMTENNEVFIRIEIQEQTNSSHEILSTWNEQIQSHILEPTIDFFNTWQSSISVPELNQYLLGYRSETPQRNYIQPVFAETNELLFSTLTLASTDEPNDCNFTNLNLEILADFVAYNDQRLFFGIQSANHSYPTSQSFTFFAYLAAIINPQANGDDIVFALMHTVDQPGIITPGLYKIFGTGMDNLTKIAEIDMQIDQGYLILACDWQPLLNDPDFMSWFDLENPAFAFISMTQKITITGGVQNADEGKSCIIYPLKNEITVSENTAPQISNLQEIITNDSFFLQLQYFDAEENFPLLAQIEFDNGQVRPFFPQTLDYSGLVVYQTYDISDIVYLDDWSQAIIRFSDDNIHFSELVYPQTFSEETNISTLPMSIYPNPASLHSYGKVNISFQTKEATTSAISIYNIKGQLIRKLAPNQINSNSILWDLHDENNKKVTAGIYFVRLLQGKQQATRKIILLP